MQVIYVTGAQRSGTTVAGQMLAASPDVTLVGEIRAALADPDAHNHCDCGRSAEVCPLWSRVRDLNQQQLASSARYAYPMRHLPRLLLATIAPRMAPLPDFYKPTIEALRMIAASADRSTIVDTSKGPNGILLWRLAGLQIYLVNCIRNPLKVAAAQAAPTAVSKLRQVGYAESLSAWFAYYLANLLLSPFASGNAVFGFSGLQRHPREYASRVWHAVHVKEDGEAGNLFHFTAHVLAGNPRRSRDGHVVIQAR